MTHRPHDALIKASLGDPKRAAELFRNVLPPGVAAAIDWSTLEAEPGELIDDALGDSHTDLLFSAALVAHRPDERGRRVALYLHCEHMSSPAADVTLRMLEYETRIWRRSWTAHPGAPLPVIVPVLLAQVGGGWTAPRSFDEMFDPAAPRTELAAHLPRFAPIVIDLGHLTDAELHAMSLDAFVKTALWFLRDARDLEQLLASYEHWWPAFCQARAAPHGRYAFRQLIRYIASILPREPFAAFHGKIARHLSNPEETIMLSYADHLRQEGRQETRDDVAGVLRQQLADKFSTIGPAYERRIAEAPMDALLRYLKRVVLADSIAAVFEGEALE